LFLNVLAPLLDAVVRNGYTVDDFTCFHG
jgi:hypothetical protein